jgi:hypothetical protein
VPVKKHNVEQIVAKLRGDRPKFRSSVACRGLKALRFGKNAGLVSSGVLDRPFWNAGRARL